MSQFQRLLRYLYPYRVRVIISVFLMFAVTLSAIPMPLFQKQVLDVAIPNRDFKMLWWIFFGVIGLYAFRAIVSYLLNYLISWLGQRIVFISGFSPTATSNACPSHTTMASNLARSCRG